MNLMERVEADLKAALKSRDEKTTSCLRLVKNALKNKEKDLLRPLGEDEALAVLKTLAKQRRESIEQFGQGGRADLAAAEAGELAIIEGYLPAQMDEAAINAVLDEVIAEVQPQGPKDMGRVMKAAMARLGAAADGKLVNALVRQRL
ncbi:MAG: GatB/YqeY domain-containing protein [Thermodesulfobacteriota bacterium]